jgi:hypothetical protein
MTICYFVQSHCLPAQVDRLIRTLRRGSARGVIVIEHDPSLCELDWAALAALPDVHRMDVPWKKTRTDYSCQVAPYFHLIDWLDERGIEYEWVVNLSGQDYPVQPLAAVEAFLESSPYDAHLRFWGVDSPESPWSRRKARARYEYHYRRLNPAWMTVLRTLRPLTKVLPIHFYLDYGALVGRRRWRTPFNGEFRCYGGWPWNTLRRDTARFVRRFIAARPDLERHYRATVIPEESLVQTVLVNAGGFRLSNDDLRYVDYTHAVGGSPRTLGCADLPQLGGGRYHFARKFDAGLDPLVLDRIDSELLRMPAMEYAR